MSTEPYVLALWAMNVSKFPAHDIVAEWIDLDEPIDAKAGKLWTRRQLAIPDLWPNKAMMDLIRFDMTNRERLRINIFINTRSSGSTTQIRAVKAAGKLLIATKHQAGNGTEDRSVHPDFPGWDPANPDAVFA